MSGCLCESVYASDRHMAQSLLGLHNLNIPQLYSLSEIIHRWCAHLEMVVFSVDLNMVMRRLKIGLTG